MAEPATSEPIRLDALANSSVRVARNGSMGRFRLPCTNCRIGQPNARSTAAMPNSTSTSVSGGTRVAWPLETSAVWRSQVSTPPATARARRSGMLVRRTSGGPPPRGDGAPPAGGGGPPRRDASSRRRARLHARCALALRLGTPRAGVDAAVDRAGVDRRLGLRQSDCGKVGDRALLAGEPLRARRELPDVLEDLGELVLVEGLLLEERRGQPVEHVAVLDDELVRLVVRGLDEVAHLLVDLLRELLRVVALM